MNASKNEAAVVATLKATRCARPVQVLTASTEPMCSRKNLTARDSAPSVSSSSRTAKMQANESHQFNDQATVQMIAADSKNRMTVKPGFGFILVETKLARIPEPLRASSIARS